MNRSKRVRTVTIGVLVIAALLLPTVSALAGDGNPATYSVTLENLTNVQPLSPPVFVTHNPAYGLFRPGAFASEGIRLIAEGGNNGPATAAAQASNQTFDVVALSALIMPRQSATARISAPPGARLSLAAMLGITNDGFTGANEVRLPHRGSVSFDLIAYDAGTEANNELADYVAGLGGTLRAPTHLPITNHPGILGIADMDPALYGWSEPAARLTITRLDK